MKKTLLFTLMKITAIQLTVALVFSAVSFGADVNAQDLLERRINVKIEQTRLNKALKQLSQLADVKFVFNSKVIHAEDRISIIATNERLADLLTRLLKPRNVQFEVSGKQIIFSRIQPEASLEITDHLAGSQSIGPMDMTVTGSVKDEKGAGLPGVSIVVKNTKRGTSSDANGNYRIDVPDASAVLVFSFVGYQKKEVIVGNQTSLTTMLVPGDQALNEVVVVGYGTVRKSDLTGSVSSVGSEKINQVPVTSLASTLQGQAAGVQVNQKSGQPGEAMIIRVRGANSITGGNDPLYVIDGMPLDGVGSDLNQGDIQSIEILKDASATAIYGSRGANGVVLITTKRGGQNKASVSYQGYYSVQSLRKKIDLLNATEYAQMVNETAQNDGKAPVYTDNQIRGFGQGTDWQDQAYRKAPMMSHQLSVTGGNDKTKYYASLNYLDQDGIVRNSGFKRLSFRINGDQTLGTRGRLSTALAVTQAKTANTYVNSELGVPFTALVMSPISGIYEADGKTYTRFTGVQWGGSNPVGLANDYYNRNTDNRVVGSIDFRYDLGKGLGIRINTGVDAGVSKSDNFAPSTITIGQPGGSALKSFGYRATIVNEDLLTYAKTVGIHGIDAVAGFTYQVNQSDGLSGSSNTFTSDLLLNNSLQSGAKFSAPSSYSSQYKLISYLGRVNYSLLNRYLLTLTGRYDGSSKFGENHKFAFFPSAAFAWRLSDEAFLQPIKSISDLKLRLSYGSSGNQAISPYQTLSQLSVVSPTFDGKQTVGFIQGSLANKDLKWETTHQFDAGVDVGFMNGRIALTADYYIKNTKDLLLQATLPTSSGFRSALRNVGEIQNKGLELQLSTKNLVGTLKWTSTLTMNFNRAKVIDLGKDAQGNAITRLEVSNVAGGNWFPLILGQSPFQLWGYKIDGVYQTNDEAVANGEPAKRAGDYRFQDSNNDGVVSDQDRMTLSKLQPKFTFGFNHNLSYKNFTLSFLLVGTYGNDIVNEFSKYYNAVNGSWNVRQEAWENRWTGPGTSNTYGRAVSTNNFGDPTSKWVEPGSYLRLRDITFAYNLSQPLLQRIKLQQLQVYVSAQNQLTITKFPHYDPEASWNSSVVNGWDRGVYPSMKSITIGLKTTF
ncbi:SusC/RagA family TonB-linked outer membrane protein [Spirosoma endbachense]|uniref:SusC/RagA family TonB-linked outer membrane protein n=1 Tax=Spirosoma endbachense TaxID=2666025 RepID=A0A6P1VPH9_9BACT|nr:TonB-dependent receptor [Spirosoma endbachense]QHV94524.1 SusC/RagA family TonB-linked outer membrane protein [Spirosoma endbachense]